MAGERHPHEAGHARIRPAASAGPAEQGAPPGAALSRSGGTSGAAGGTAPWAAAAVSGPAPGTAAGIPPLSRRERLRRTAAIVAWLTGLIRRRAPWVLGVLLLLTLLGSALNPLTLLLSRSLTDTAAALIGIEQPGRRSLAPESAYALALWLVAGLGLARLVRSALTALEPLALAVAQEHLDRELRQQLAHKGLRLPLAWLEQPAFHNRLRQAQQAGGSRVVTILRAALDLGTGALTLVSYLALVIRLHPALAALLLATGGAMAWARVKGGVSIWQIRWRQVEVQRRIQYLADLVASRRSAHEVRLFGLGRYFIQAWEHFTRQTRRQQIRQGSRNELLFLASSLPSHLAYGLGLWLILDGMAAGRLTVGDYVLLAGAIQGAHGLLQGLIGQVGTLAENLLACGDAYDFLRLPEEDWEAVSRAAGAATPARPESGQRPFPPLQRGIRLEGVRFTYPGTDREVLQGIDLEIRAGEHLAVVGANGSGKTTLVKLLLGLYQPTAGRILVDGVPQEQIAPEAWRRAFAVVFQDFAQFELTARENLGFGRLEALHDDDALLRAAQLGGASEVLARLPEGLETVLGRTLGGTDLSGGEWQRLAMSRAFLRQAPVLILDEPTAALDPLAEAEVYERFASLAAGRTVLLISHRLASCRLADRIVVLDAGRIVEEGTHHELLARGGLYASYFRLQAHWYGREVAARG